MLRILLAVLLHTWLTLSALAYASDTAPREVADPAASRLMSLGIKDEPSIKIGCNDQQESIRLVDYSDRHARALVRVIKHTNLIAYTFRRFDSGKEVESETHLLQEPEWKSLVDGLEKDTFWITPSTETTWRPHGLRWMLEACLLGRYRTHTIDPDFEFRMNDFVDNLVGFKNDKGSPATP